MPLKPLVRLRGEIATPPLSRAARREAGYLLYRLQRGDLLSMPESRSMPDIGRRCYELRIKDGGNIWRIIYRIDADAIVIADVFAKKTQRTPKGIIDNCKRRLSSYDQAA